MSFWKESPGPSWWDCIESLNPCVEAPYGLCDPNLLHRPRNIALPKYLHSQKLSHRHSDDIELLLKDHYTIYDRCRIYLSKDRIRKGFLYDGWIGVGIYTADKCLIGCCISKALGSLKFPREIISSAGLIDYFCIHTEHRKQGLASILLNELVFLTSQQSRTIHVFLKEGFPLLSLPPLYHSQYINRKKQNNTLYKDYLGDSGIAIRVPIQTFSHTDFLPLQRFVANIPSQLNEDSKLYGFNYKGHDIFLCMTDIHHRTVPDGLKVGELCWILPKTAEVPLFIQQIAVETCIDNSPFDIVMMDKSIPHSPKKPWQKDASFSWYVFNYNPGCFFSMKPYWIF